LSLLLVFLLTGAPMAALASDPPPDVELAPRERQAIASVDVMPVVERLHDQLGLSRAPTAVLSREAVARERSLTPDPLVLELRGADTFIELFSLIAMLRELHRRDALDLRLRGVESAAAFHLGQLGARYLTDPLLDRRLRTWRDRELDPARQAALRDVGISIQAASEIGDRWFAETLQTARLVDPSSPILDARIGLWLIGVGERARGVSYLEGLRGVRPDSPDVLRALALGLRTAERETAANALRDELRATAPLVYLEVVRHERRLADHKAEVRFRVSPRPRPAQAWIDHVQRLQRDPAAAPVDIDQALELAREDHPTDLRIARLAATVLAARADVDGLDRWVTQAQRAGIELTGLRDVQVVLALLRVLAPQLGDSRSDPLDDLQRAVAAWRSDDANVDPAVAEGVMMLATIAVAARSDQARDQRKAGRSARRLARRHKARPEALRASAAALYVLGDAPRATKVLDRGARRLPSIERGALLLDAVELAALAAESPGASARVPELLGWIERAESLGARPEIARVLGARLALLAVIGDGIEVDRAMFQAPTLQLDEAVRRLGGRPADSALIADASRALSASWLLADDLGRSTQTLARARRLEPGDAFSELVLGLHATLDRAPAAARAHLQGAASLGSSARGRFALARWTLAVCEQVGDPHCQGAASRSLLDSWDDAGAPEATGVWTTPFVGGEIRLGATLSVDGPLALDVAIRAKVAPLVLLPHDREATRAAAESAD